MFVLTLKYFEKFILPSMSFELSIPVLGNLPRPPIFYTCGLFILNYINTFEIQMSLKVKLFKPHCNFSQGGVSLAEHLVVGLKEDELGTISRHPANRRLRKCPTGKTETFKIWHSRPKFCSVDVY